MGYSLKIQNPINHGKMKKKPTFSLQISENDLFFPETAALFALLFAILPSSYSFLVN